MLRELEEYNELLKDLNPTEIISWAMATFSSGLYQTTAFGPTGMVISSIASSLGGDIPVIFIDTLYRN